MMTEISQEQFDRMVRGSMARGIAYGGDPTEREAESRVKQMLARAGITVKGWHYAPHPNVGGAWVVYPPEGPLAANFWNEDDAEAFVAMKNKEAK